MNIFIYFNMEMRNSFNKADGGALQWAVNLKQERKLPQKDA